MILIFFLVGFGIVGYNAGDMPPQKTTKEVYEQMTKEKEYAIKHCFDATYCPRDSGTGL